MQDSCRIFCELILEMGRKEKKLEVIRQVLCEIPDFEPYSTFKRLDKSHKNFIDQTDISEFLSGNSLDYEEMLIKDSLIQHYDTDFDFRLQYSEYLVIFSHFSQFYHIFIGF